MSGQACVSVWWGQLTGSRLSGRLSQFQDSLWNGCTAWDLHDCLSILTTPRESGRSGGRLGTLAEISGDGCATVNDCGGPKAPEGCLSAIPFSGVHRNFVCSDS